LDTNVGKSTLFNALTSAAIASENYPFCTIEPNVGAVAIPDARLTTINRLYRNAGKSSCHPATGRYCRSGSRGIARRRAWQPNFANIRNVRRHSARGPCFSDPDAGHSLRLLIRSDSNRLTTRHESVVDRFNRSTNGSTGASDGPHPDR